MTEQEFYEINWHRGNVVKLQNGKEYLVKGTKGHGKYLLLYSQEYNKSFVADYRIVDCRTSDYEEPEEVYLEMKRQKQAEAAAQREAERQEYLRAKAERKLRNIQEQERIHLEALARKEAIKREKIKAQAAKQATQQSASTTKQPAPKIEQPKVEQSKPKVEQIKHTETPITDTSKAPVAEAPKKRVRQRIRISSATPVREKVEYFKKK